MLIIHVILIKEMPIMDRVPILVEIFTASNSNTAALNLQQLLTYKNVWGEHALDVLLGHETYDRSWNSLSGIKYNLYDPESEEISNAIVKPAVYSSER